MKKSIGGFVSPVLAALVLIFSQSGLVSAVDRDVVKDGCIDWADVASFAEQWLDEGCSAAYWCGGADISRSGNVDFNDFVLLAQDWGAVYPFVTTFACRP